MYPGALTIPARTTKTKDVLPGIAHIIIDHQDGQRCTPFAFGHEGCAASSETWNMTEKVIVTDKP